MMSLMKNAFVLMAAAVVMLISGCDQPSKTDAPQPPPPPSPPSVGRVAPRPPSETVRPEVWTSDFITALAKAKAENRPMIITGGSTGCGGCMKMERSLDDRAFQYWVKGSGIYLVRIHVNTAAKTPTQAEGLKFLKALPSEGKVSIPHIGVYWPRKEGEAVTAHFRYHRGRMPGAKRNPALTGELISALENVLGEYFKGSPRPKWDEVLAASKKKITVVADCAGEVATIPANGELVCGKSLKLLMKPKAGSRFVGWKGPNGKIIEGHKSSSLNLQYSAAEGVYTAVFKK